MKNILVAYDGGLPARRALETGIELAKRFDASLAVVSFVPINPALAPFDPWDDRSVHEAHIAEARDVLSQCGFAAALFEPTDHPATTLERVAGMGHYDTIVVSSRGMDAVARFLRASVQEPSTTRDATVVVAA